MLQPRRCPRRPSCRPAPLVAAALLLHAVQVCGVSTTYSLSVDRLGVYTLTSGSGSNQVLTLDATDSIGSSQQSVGLTPEQLSYGSTAAVDFRSTYNGSRPLSMWYWQYTSEAVDGLYLTETISRRPDDLTQLRWNSATRYPGTTVTTDNVYQLSWAAYSPWLSYVIKPPVGSRSNLIVCDAVIPHAQHVQDAQGNPTGVDCCVGLCSDSGAQRVVRYDAIVEQSPAGIGSIAFVLDSGEAEALKTAAYAVALDRLRAWRRMHLVTEDILTSNDDRKDGARATTAVLLTIVAIGMLLISLICGVVLGWAVSPIPVPGALAAKFDGEEGKIKFNTLVMVTACTVVNFTVSAAAGFTGWFVMGVLFFFFSVIYGCCGGVRRVERRNCCWASNFSGTAVAPTTSPTAVAPAEEGGGAQGAAPAPQKDQVETEAAPHCFPERCCFGCCCGSSRLWLNYGPCCGADAKNSGAMGRRQEWCVWVNTGLMLFFCVVIMIVVFAWDIKDYKIVRRDTSDVEVEIIPPLTAKAVQFMYAWDGLATNLKLQIYTKWLTQWCGRKFKETLGASGKDTSIYDAFIDEYNINMSEYHPSDYRNYSSVNEWFIRHLAPHVRPIAGHRLAPTTGGWAVATPTQRAASVHANTVLSPADCRMLIYPSLQAARVWIKGSRFNFFELIDERPEYRDTFTGGSMVIARLAPQDYHRFNSPITGVVTAQYDIDGTYWSVNADAARSKNYAFYNLRRVIIMDYAARDGTTKKMAYVAIGATCVGSVVFTGPTGAGVSVGTQVAKGDELGFMQFGGSTVILLFEQDELAPDSDILRNSEKPVETYIRVRERLGVLRT